MRRATRLIAFVLVTIAVIGGLLLYLRATTLIEGDIGRFQPTGASGVIAADLEAFNAVVTGNTAAGPALLGAGRLMLVPRGTRIKVLEADARHYRVEILDGQYAGRTGYTAAAFVQR